MEEGPFADVEGMDVMVGLSARMNNAQEWTRPQT